VSRNIVWQLRDASKINKSIVSYNITFNPDPKEDIEDSYIQIGDVSRDVLGNTSWILTNGWNSWSAPVSLSFFKQADKLYPFLEYNATAIFDP